MAQTYEFISSLPFFAIIARNKKPVERLFHIIGQPANSDVKPVLAIRVGKKHCAFSITDAAAGYLIKLAYYVSPEINETFLNELFTDEPDLNLDYSQVLVCYDHPESCIVPENLFRQDATGNLIQIVYGMSIGQAVIAEPVELRKLYNVFAVPKDVHERMRRKFSVGKYWHQYTLAIKNLSGQEVGSRLQVEFRKDDFTVICTDSSNLLLAKTYEYSTPPDVLFYLLRICRQYKLSQEKVKLEISGLVDQQSALYRELYQYFTNLQFRETAWKSEESFTFFYFPQ